MFNFEPSKAIYIYDFLCSCLILLVNIFVPFLVYLEEYSIVIITYQGGRQFLLKWVMREENT